MQQNRLIEAEISLQSKQNAYNQLKATIDTLKYQLHSKIDYQVFKILKKSGGLSYFCKLY